MANRYFDPARCKIKYCVEKNQLIEQGNQHRSQQQYHEALSCYAQVFAQDFQHAAAFNNYGNVLREMGYPERALPFLESAIQLDPNNSTAKFNRAVTLLLMGDYDRGWPAYEVRWNYEHLAGTEPKFSQGRWRGEDLKDKTILVVGEQGHGDNIQFVRFLWNLHVAGAKIKLQVTEGLVPLLATSNIIEKIGRYTDDLGDFDYWIPIMSIPGVLGITLQNLPKVQQYLNPAADLVQAWQKRLGPKRRMRVGFGWSGRRDAWLNQHKGVPFEIMLDMIKRHPQHEWINLQVDCTAEEEQQLVEAGVTAYPNSIGSFADSAALMSHMDVIIGVDTAVSHLSGALGRPTWVMLNKFAQDWRWLLNRDDSPWYSTVRLFRQENYNDWSGAVKKIEQYLSWFKV